MFALFALVTALGAALLFLIEPIAAKSMLPWLGGSAAVWTVSLVFFQIALLGGYAYAHVLARRLRPRQMAFVHGALTLLAALLLPWRGTAPEAPGQAPPELWILGTLATSVGLPFFVLAATGPLLQRWFADLPGRREPYPLYAVGNAASLAALLAYPLLVERHLPLAAYAGAFEPTRGLTQHALWSAGFVVFAAFVLLCGARAARLCVPIVRRSLGGVDPRGRILTIVWWGFLGFVPTATMLGTTQALTTDVAAVPLLWVLPLATYLATFVLAFAWPERLPLRVVSWATAILVVAVAGTHWLAFRPAPQVILPLYLASLFAVGLLCHGRLVRERPLASDLTAFYLSIAAGGALASVFCGLVAPALFRSIVEYPIGLVLACLARPHRSEHSWRRGAIADLALVAAFGAVVAIVHATWGAVGVERASSMRIEVALACLACALLALRPRAFAVAVAGLFMMADENELQGHDILATRTFFGVLRVKDKPGAPFFADTGAGGAQIVQLPMHSLYHGTTLHGIQVRSARHARLPTTYYHPSGPIGGVFAGLRDASGRRLDEVAIVGLGVGSLAAYAAPGERFTFFEIDPEVVRIARDPELFSFLGGTAGAEVIVGDGRTSLAAQPDGRYALIVMDAFSSDAMPVHLLTREALAMLLRKLRPGGLLVYNLSSSHFDLPPVLAEAAAALGKEGLYWDDQALPRSDFIVAKQTSCWAVVAPKRADLVAVRRTGPWLPLSSTRRVAGGPWLWTDRRSSPLAALKW